MTVASIRATKIPFSSESMRRQRRSLPGSGRRNKVGLIAVAVGFVLAALSAVFSTSVHAATNAANFQAVSWTTWVEAGSSVIKIIQMVAFVFGAYQFWAQRKERLAADATNDAQAQKDANYQAWQVVNAAQGKGGRIARFRSSTPGSRGSSARSDARHQSVTEPRRSG